MCLEGLADFPTSTDLFRGRNPADFYTCQIDDRSAVERWVESSNAKHLLGQMLIGVPCAASK